MPHFSPSRRASLALLATIVLPPLFAAAEPFTAHMEQDPDYRRFLVFPTRLGYHYTVERSADLEHFEAAADVGAAIYGDGNTQRFLFLEEPPPPTGGNPPPAKPTKALSMTLHTFNSYGTMRVRLDRTATVQDAAWSKVLSSSFPRQNVPVLAFAYAEDPEFHYCLSLICQDHPDGESDTVAETSPFPAQAQSELAMFEALLPAILGQVTRPPTAPVPTSGAERWFFRVLEREIDSNQNGLWDAFELAAYMDPFATEGMGTFMDAEDDYDLDGVSNLTEQEKGTDPWNADTDNDGAPDGQDSQPTNPQKHGPVLAKDWRSGSFGNTTLPTIAVGANWPDAVNTSYSLPEDTPQMSLADVIGRAASENPFPAGMTLRTTNNAFAGGATFVFSYAQVQPPPAGIPGYTGIFAEHSQLAMIRGPEETAGESSHTYLRLKISKANPPEDWSTPEGIAAMLDSPDSLEITSETFTIPDGATKSNVVSLSPTGGGNAEDFVAVDLLANLEFVTGAADARHAISRLPISTGPPSVVLKTITAADVSVSGGEATVIIEGDVYDAIMGAVPADHGADIEEVKVFLNGAESSFSGALQRQTDEETFWAPFGPKAKIQPITVTMPASGINHIKVETSPNAAGIRGKAEFQVVFEKTFGEAVQHASQSMEVDLLLPANLSTTAADTVEVAWPGQAPMDSLVESGPDTRKFVSAETGRMLTIAGDYAPTAQPDSLRCYVSGLGAGAGESGLGGGVTCVETGPTTLRFAYVQTIPAQSESAPYEWTLASVDMGAEGYTGVTHPIAFRTMNLGQNAKLIWHASEFPITPDEAETGYYASTSTGKPLIGFLVPKAVEGAADSREFIYYDHAASVLQRKEVPAAATESAYKVKIDQTSTDDLILPIADWRMLNLDGTSSEGLLPVNIEALIDLAEGDATIEIPEESKALVEISGRQAGEVLRIFSPVFTNDLFDLAVPGAQPWSPLATRKLTLEEAASGVFRTQQSLVLYTSGGDAPETLTSAQWEALKAAGIVAVHNGAPVIGSTEDLEWAMKQFGPPHPGPGVPMGVNGVTDPGEADFHRFPGYQDHHVFNQYDGNPAKRARWNLIFGDDFDVDEFTVPVKRKYHQKFHHHINNGWEEFLSGYFDSSHKLKSGVNLQDLRRQTLDKMRSLHGQWGIDTSLLRPYPTILDKYLKQRPTLCNRLIKNQGRLGCSMDKFKVIDEMAFGPLLRGAESPRNSWWKNTIKKIYKREGKKGIGKLIPMVSAAMTVHSVVSAAIDTKEYGWEEAAAQALNNQLDLGDIELARESIRQQFNTGLIGGGLAQPAIALRNGQILGMNERTFRCFWNPDGTISQVVPYVISEIKVFPDGPPKVAAVMEVPPFETRIVEDPDYIIRDYWPAVGDSKWLFEEARSRAMLNAAGTP